jgi:hypothetical protein
MQQRLRQFEMLTVVQLPGPHLVKALMQLAGLEPFELLQQPFQQQV